MAKLAKLAKNHLEQAINLLAMTFHRKRDRMAVQGIG
jgi:hypothetical protein